MALTDNLVSYWKLDESSGNASDSVGSNTLTNVGSITYSSGKINNGANLTNSNNFTLSSALMSSGSTGTISLWIKTTATTGTIYQGRLSGTPFFQINFGETGKFGVVMYNGIAYTKVDDTAKNDGNWHHIVAIFSSTYIQLIIDNIDKGKTTFGSTGLWGSDSKFGYSGQGFFGMLDEIGVWSRALTSDEITTLYNAGAGIQYPFSVGSSKFFQLF